MKTKLCRTGLGKKRNDAPNPLKGLGVLLKLPLFCSPKGSTFQSTDHPSPFKVSLSAILSSSNFSDCFYSSKPFALFTCPSFSVIIGRLQLLCGYTPPLFNVSAFVHPSRIKNIIEKETEKVSP